MAATITIRDAVESDAESIWRIHTDSIAKICSTRYSCSDIEPWIQRQQPEKYIPFIRQDTFIVAQTATRELVGFGHMGSREGACSSSMHIKGLYVSPESAGNGIGKLLMRELEKRARNCGCALLVLASSLNAVGFYESCGFYVKEQSSSSHCTQCTSGHQTLACINMEKTL